MWYGYVYETKNRVNGKAYVGQHKGAFDPTYVGSGSALQTAVRKHGKGSFSVKTLVLTRTREEADEIEKIIISAYREMYGKRNLYNIAEGGQGSQGLLRKHTKEELTKLKENHADVAGTKNPMFGKKQSASQNKAAREANLGTKMVNKNGTNQRVHSKDLGAFLENGWVLGMITKRRIYNGNL